MDLSILLEGLVIKDPFEVSELSPSVRHLTFLFDGFVIKDPILAPVLFSSVVKALTFLFYGLVIQSPIRASISAGNTTGACTDGSAGIATLDCPQKMGKRGKRGEVGNDVMINTYKKNYL